MPVAQVECPRAVLTSMPEQVPGELRSRRRPVDPTGKAGRCVGHSVRVADDPVPAGSETIADNRHGKVIGPSIPLERDEDDVRRAVAPLGAAVGPVPEETGKTENELARVCDLRRSMPE